MWPVRMSGMIDIIKVIKLEKLGDFRLRLHFSNGTRARFSDIVAEGGPMVDPLRDATLFDRSSSSSAR